MKNHNNPVARRGESAYNKRTAYLLKVYKLTEIYTYRHVNEDDIDCAWGRMQIGFINFYGAVLDVGQQRESLVANNIANADTPGYKARDVSFDAAMTAQLADAPDASALAAAEPGYRVDGTVALDGNDVSLDRERIEAAQNGERMIGAATFLHQSTADLVTALRPNPGGT